MGVLPLLCSSRQPDSSHSHPSYLAGRHPGFRRVIWGPILHGLHWPCPPGVAEQSPQKHVPIWALSLRGLCCCCHRPPPPSLDVQQVAWHIAGWLQAAGGLPHPRGLSPLAVGLHTSCYQLSPVPSSCSGGPRPPAPGCLLSPGGSVWGEAEKKQGRQTMKKERLYFKIQKSPGKQSRPQPSAAEHREEPATLCELSNRAARAMAVPRPPSHGQSGS